MLRLSRITRSFGATRALDDVSLDVREGIVALVGENGAGKTTLMRIAARELSADSGEIESSGHVELVHQHFLLVNELTIAENLALTSRRFRFATKKTVEREARETIAKTGIVLDDVTRRVGDLSVGEKSKLELIKAISKNPSTLILDEPTAVLTPYESEELFRVMRTLASQGTAVVFISHKLPEVLAVAERIVVMRGGRVVAETEGEETTAQELAKLMVGARSSEEVRVKSEESGLTPLHSSLLPLHSTGLELIPNRIVAIVGVAGNGQPTLAAHLRDALPLAGHIPEDRTRDGIVAELSIAENLALRGVRNASDVIARYSIRAHGPSQRAGDLSGGNQQKVVLARELDRAPEVIVAAEPTRGLDLDSTRFVHQQLRAAASNGAAVLLITSDLDEAFALADAIHVIYRGKLSERMTIAEATTRVANLMAGIA